MLRKGNVAVQHLCAGSAKRGRAIASSMPNRFGKRSECSILLGTHLLDRRSGPGVLPLTVQMQRDLLKRHGSYVRRMKFE